MKTRFFALICFVIFFSCKGQNQSKLPSANDTENEMKDLIKQLQTKQRDGHQSPYNSLSKFESYVLNEKGTERAYTGEFYAHKAQGVYMCKKCAAPLYTSTSKFESHCGWPSFDDEIENAVNRIPDQDGRRTEIVCNNCKGHLGHVFFDEGFTKKNTRHCVNSASLNFVPLENNEEVNRKDSTIDSATFGAGCFWCVEAIFQNLKGVSKVESGYSGGQLKNPTYKEVCSGISGHAEVAQIVFDTSIITYNQLLEIFFHIHNPTTPNRQGADIGTQYRSVIFYHTAKQQEEARKILDKIESSGLWNEKIVTEIEPLINYYPAEDYHQNYYKNNPNQGYCSIVIAPKLRKFKKEYADLLVNPSGK